MMERLVNLHGEKVVQMLTMQYRLDIKKGGGDGARTIYIFRSWIWQGCIFFISYLPPFFLTWNLGRDVVYEITELIIVKYTCKHVLFSLRMNKLIMQWSSDALYAGQVVAGPAVSSHRLCDLPGVTQSELTETVLLLIDTAGSGMDEFTTSDGLSKGMVVILTDNKFLSKLHPTVYLMVKKWLGFVDIQLLKDLNSQLHYFDSSTYSMAQLLKVKSKYTSTFINSMRDSKMKT